MADPVTGDPQASLPPGFGGLVSTQAPLQEQQPTVQDDARERARTLTKQAIASGEISGRDTQAIRDYAKTAYRGLIRRDAGETAGIQGMAAAAMAGGRQLAAGNTPSSFPILPVQARAGGIGSVMAGLSQAAVSQLERDPQEIQAEQLANEARAQRQQYLPKVRPTGEMVQQELERGLEQQGPAIRAGSRFVTGVGEGVGVPLEAQLALGNTGRSGPQRQEMASRIRQGNQAVGGPVEDVAEGAGNALGMVGSIEALRGIPLPLLRDPGAIGSAARMATYSAAQPEAIEALGGPEAQGTVLGRAAEGVALDALMRGAGRFATPAVPAATKAGQAIDRAIAGSGTGAALGVGMGSAPERIVGDALTFGALGAAHGDPARPTTEQARPAEARPVERPAGPEVRLDQLTPEQRAAVTVPDEYLQPKNTAPSTRIDESAARQTERSARISEPSAPVKTNPLADPGASERNLEKSAQESAQPPQKSEVTPQIAGKLAPAAWSRYVRERTERLKTQDRTAGEELAQAMEARGEPQRAELIRSRMAKWTTPPEQQELHGGVPVPRQVRTMLRDAFVDTGRSERRMAVWRGRAERGIGRALDRVLPSARRKLGIDSPRPELRPVRDIQKKWDQRIYPQYTRLAAALERIGPEKAKQFWRDIETHQDLPADHPLKSVEQAFDSLVTEVGDLQLRAKNIPQETLAEFRRPGVQRYVKHIPASRGGKMGKEFAELKRRIAQGALAEGNRYGDRPGAWTEAGLRGAAKGVEDTIKSATSRRRRLTLEQMESDRVVMKDGTMLFGEVKGVTKDGIRLQREGVTVKIPNEQIERIEDPYITGEVPLLRTVLEQGRIGSALEQMEYVKEKLPGAWREPPQHGTAESKNKDWVTLPDEPQWGVLKGKQVRRALYDEVTFIRRPERSGFGEFSESVNNIIKQGQTIGRPGYHVKSVIENGLSLLHFGFPLERLLDRSWKHGRDLWGFLKTGEETPTITALLKEGQLLGSGHLQELGATEPGMSGGQFHRIQSRGVQYLKDFRDQYAQNVRGMLEGYKKGSGKNEAGIFHHLAAHVKGFAEGAYGLELLKAANLQPGKLRISGEGLQYLAAYTDAVTRMIAYEHLTTNGPMGYIRRGIRSAGQAAGMIPKGSAALPHREAMQSIRNIYDTRTLAPIVSGPFKFTFLRMPIMSAKELLKGRGLTQPHALVTLFGTARVIQGVVNALMSDEDQEKAEQVKAGAGVYSRGGKDNLVAWKTPDGEWKVLDVGALTLNGLQNSLVPGEELKEKPGEHWVERAVRGVAAAVPVISQGARALGYDVLRGEASYDKSVAGQAYDALATFLPLAASGAQWTGSKDLQDKQEREARFPTSDTSTRLFRLISGMRQTKMPDPSSPEFQQFRSLMQYDARRQRQMGLGMQYKPELKMPKPPGENATEAERELFRQQMREYAIETGYIPGVGRIR